MVTGTRVYIVTITCTEASFDGCAFTSPFSNRFSDRTSRREMSFCICCISFRSACFAESGLLMFFLNVLDVIKDSMRGKVISATGM